MRPSVAIAYITLGKGNIVPNKLEIKKIKKQYNHYTSNCFPQRYAHTINIGYLVIKPNMPPTTTIQWAMGQPT